MFESIYFKLQTFFLADMTNINANKPFNYFPLLSCFGRFKFTQRWFPELAAQLNYRL